MKAETEAAGRLTSPAGDMRPSFWTKFIYGTGDWGMASFNTLRQVFYVIFLTDVVGLAPLLGALAAFVGAVWDAINDPLVGAFSDRIKTRWGRRRPFLLIFAIPFGLSFMLLWWAPAWQSQIALAIHVTLAYMISDTLQTLVIVPYLSLTPEIAPDYDDRTSVTGYRMVFNLIASIVTAMAAPMIQDGMLKAGFSLQQGYLVTGALFGGLAALPFLVMFFAVREQTKPQTEKAPSLSLRRTIRTLWVNIPFRFAALLYMLNWITVELVALMLPFFLVYWVAGGDQLASINILGMELPLRSAVLGEVLIVAMLAVPLWTWLARRLSKRKAYMIGMAFWLVVQALLLTVQPGQVNYALLLALFAGISVSVAHVLPEAIFPDVIEWDELKTRQRHEGIYYGATNFMRKLTSAMARSLALLVLGLFGYQTPPEGAIQFAQPAQALQAIRMLTGLAGGLFLLASILAAWFYPITRERHARIRGLLARRRARAVRSE